MEHYEFGCLSCGKYRDPQASIAAFKGNMVLESEAGRKYVVGICEECLATPLDPEALMRNLIPSEKKCLQVRGKESENVKRHFISMMESEKVVGLYQKV